MTYQDFIRLERRYEHLISPQIINIRYEEKTQEAFLFFRIDEKIWVQKGRYNSFSDMYNRLNNISDLRNEMMNPKSSGSNGPQTTDHRP